MPLGPNNFDSLPAAAGREAALAAENKDLVVRLSSTHRKLKLLRSKSQQCEAMQDAKVRGPNSLDVRS